jgi:hypothetical protein
MNGAVSTLAVYGGKLYAGGSFLFAGGSLIPFMAKWTLQQRSMIPANDEGVNESIIFPNPNRNNEMIKLKIDLNDYPGTTFNFRIYDATGRMISNVSNIKNEFNFDRKNTPPGLYFYKIISSNNEEVQDGTLLIE